MVNAEARKFEEDKKSEAKVEMKEEDQKSGKPDEKLEETGEKKV